jgi:hypothetical protein
MRLRLAKNDVGYRRSVSEMSCSGVLKFPCAPSIYYIKNYKHAASRNMDRNGSVFANSRLERLLKAIVQLLGTAERV